MSPKYDMGHLEFKAQKVFLNLTHILAILLKSKLLENVE